MHFLKIEQTSFSATKSSLNICKRNDIFFFHLACESHENGFLPSAVYFSLNKKNLEL